MGVSIIFCGISCLRKDLFKNYECGEKIKLSNIFQFGITQKILADIYLGEWFDIGTPQRLDELNDLYKN